MADQSDVPVSPESSVEERLAQYFSPPKKSVAPTVESTEVEVEEPQQTDEISQEQPEVESAEEGGDDQVSDQPPEGFVELEHLGKKYHVPPDLKQAFESQRSLATKVTQETASIRRALEVEKIAMQAAKAAEGELRELSNELARLNSYKEQAKKLDWSQLTLDQKVDLDRELRQVDEQMNMLGQQMSVKQNDARQKFGQFVVAAVHQTEQYMATKVPGWNVDTGKALHEYGSTLGIPTEKLTSGWFADPVATHVMWKAQQWDRLQGSKPSVQNRSKNAPPVIKPASNQVQKSVAQSNIQKDRSQLKRTGSLEDAARLFMRMK